MAFCKPPGTVGGKVEESFWGTCACVCALWLQHHSADSPVSLLGQSLGGGASFGCVGSGRLWNCTHVFIFKLGRMRVPFPLLARYAGNVASLPQIIRILRKFFAALFSTPFINGSHQWCSSRENRALLKHY